MMQNTTSTLKMPIVTLSSPVPVEKDGSHDSKNYIHQTPDSGHVIPSNYSICRDSRTVFCKMCTALAHSAHWCEVVFSWCKAVKCKSFVKIMRIYSSRDLFELSFKDTTIVKYSKLSKKKSILIFLGVTCNPN